MTGEREPRGAVDDAEGMTKLHELALRPMPKTELQPVLEDILNATIALLKADCGYVQLYDARAQALRIVAQRGWSREFLDYFDNVGEGTGCCGTALTLRERVVVEDVLTHPGFDPHLAIVRKAGIRAVQSTPLLGRRGDVLGMISTHFREPHRPADRQLRLLDLYARQAAEMIELTRAEDALHASEERFRRYFELGLVGMAMTSPTKAILEVNDELCRMLGYERNELLQQTSAGLTHPDDLAADEAQFNRVMAGEIDGYTLDKRWIRKDGRIIDSIMSARCLRRADGSVDSFVGLVQDITDRKRAENERAELFRHLIAAQEEERRRIAREMHDQFGQQLSALKWKVGALRRKYRKRETLHEEVLELEAIVTQLDRDMDFVVRKIRPTALDDLGLVAALGDFVNSWSRHFNVKAELHSAGMERERLTTEVETVLYRVTQEGLTNIARHAGARHVSVLLARRSDHVSLIIDDDGSGFDEEQVRTSELKRLGLVGMRERVTYIGGTLAIESRPGDGVTVVVRIPIATPVTATV